MIIFLILVSFLISINGPNKWYNTADLSEGIDFDKVNNSKECAMCHYWYFKGLNFEISL